MAGSFGGDIVSWTKKAEAAEADVLHRALRLLVEEVMSTVPVVTGNLRNSVAVSSAPVTLNWTTKKFRDPTDQLNHAIAGIEPGESAYVGFRAPYAGKVEAKHGFMRLAQQRWRYIVAEAVGSRGALVPR